MGTLNLFRFALLLLCTKIYISDAMMTAVVSLGALRGNDVGQVIDNTCCSEASQCTVDNPATCQYRATLCMFVGEFDFNAPCTDEITLYQSNVGNSAKFSPGVVSVSVPIVSPDELFLKLVLRDIGINLLLVDVAVTFPRVCSSKSCAAGNTFPTNFIGSRIRNKIFIPANVTLECDRNYYGDQCQTFCNEELSSCSNGFYTCSDTGEKLCAEGWNSTSSCTVHDGTTCPVGGLTCQNGAACTPNGGCCCPDFFEGRDCSKPIGAASCNGGSGISENIITNNELHQCSGEYDCVSNKKKCLGEFEGPECNILRNASAQAAASSCPDDCGYAEGRGYCNVRTQKCCCYPGYYGSRCVPMGSCSSNQLNNTDVISNFSRNQCTGQWDCLNNMKNCSRYNFTGVECNVPNSVLQSDTWCGDCGQADGRGYCNSDGTCCCNSGYSGDSCEYGSCMRSTKPDGSINYGPEYRNNCIDGLYVCQFISSDLVGIKKCFPGFTGPHCMHNLISNGRAWQCSEDIYTPDNCGYQPALCITRKCCCAGGILVNGMCPPETSTQSSTAESTSTQASTAESTSTQASTTESTSTQASTTESSTQISETTQSSTSETTSTQASTSETTSTQSSTSEASSTQTSTSEAPTTTTASTTTEATTTTETSTTSTDSTTIASTTSASTTAETTSTAATTESTTTATTTTESTTTSPTTTESTTTAPTTTESTTTSPTTTESTTTSPTTTESTTTSPTTTESTTMSPTTTESTTTSPTTTESTTTSPTTTESTTTSPTTTESTTTSPTTTESTTTPPTTTESTTTSPTTTESTTAEATTAEPSENATADVATDDLTPEQINDAQQILGQEGSNRRKRQTSVTSRVTITRTQRMVSSSGYRFTRLFMTVFGSLVGSVSNTTLTSRINTQWNLTSSITYSKMITESAFSQSGTFFLTFHGKDTSVLLDDSQWTHFSSAVTTYFSSVYDLSAYSSISCEVLRGDDILGIEGSKIAGLEFVLLGDGVELSPTDIGFSLDTFNYTDFLTVLSGISFQFSDVTAYTEASWKVKSSAFKLFFPNFFQEDNWDFLINQLSIWWRAEYPEFSTTITKGSSETMIGLDGHYYSQLLYFVQLNTTTHELLTPLNLLIRGPTTEIFFSLTGWPVQVNFTEEEKTSIDELYNDFQVDAGHVSTSTCKAFAIHETFRLLIKGRLPEEIKDDFEGPLTDILDDIGGLQGTGFFPLRVVEVVLNDSSIASNLIFGGNCASDRDGLAVDSRRFGTREPTADAYRDALSAIRRPDENPVEVVTDQRLINSVTIELDSLFSFLVRGSVYLEDIDMLIRACRTAFLAENSEYLSLNLTFQFWYNMEVFLTNGSRATTTFYSIHYENMFGDLIFLDVRNILNLMVTGAAIQREIGQNYMRADGTSLTLLEVTEERVVRRDDCLAVFVDFPPLPEQENDFAEQIKTMITNNIVDLVGDISVYIVTMDEIYIKEDGKPLFAILYQVEQSGEAFWPERIPPIDEQELGGVRLPITGEGEFFSLVTEDMIQEMIYRKESLYFFAMNKTIAYLDRTEIETKFKIAFATAKPEYVMDDLDVKIISIGPVVVDGVVETQVLIRVFYLGEIVSAILERPLTIAQLNSEISKVINPQGEGYECLDVYAYQAIGMELSNQLVFNGEITIQEDAVKTALRQWFLNEIEGVVEDNVEIVILRTTTSLAKETTGSVRRGDMLFTVDWLLLWGGYAVSSRALKRINTVKLTEEINKLVQAMPEQTRARELNVLDIEVDQIIDYDKTFSLSLDLPFHESSRASLEDIIRQNYLQTVTELSTMTLNVTILAVKENYVKRSLRSHFKFYDHSFFMVRYMMSVLNATSQQMFSLSAAVETLTNDAAIVAEMETQDLKSTFGTSFSLVDKSSVDEAVRKELCQIIAAEKEVSQMDLDTLGGIFSSALGVSAGGMEINVANTAVSYTEEREMYTIVAISLKDSNTMKFLSTSRLQAFNTATLMLSIQNSLASLRVKDYVFVNQMDFDASSYVEYNQMFKTTLSSALLLEDYESAEEKCKQEIEKRAEFAGSTLSVFIGYQSESILTTNGSSVYEIGFIIKQQVTGDTEKKIISALDYSKMTKEELNAVFNFEIKGGSGKYSDIIVDMDDFKESVGVSLLLTHQLYSAAMVSMSQYSDYENTIRQVLLDLNVDSSCEVTVIKQERVFIDRKLQWSLQLIVNVSGVIMRVVDVPDLNTMVNLNRIRTQISSDGLMTPKGQNVELLGMSKTNATRTEQAFYFVLSAMVQLTDEQSLTDELLKAFKDGRTGFENAATEFLGHLELTKFKWRVYYAVSRDDILVGSNFVSATSESVLRSNIANVKITGSADVSLNTKFILDADVGDDVTYDSLLSIYMEYYLEEDLYAALESVLTESLMDSGFTGAVMTTVQSQEETKSISTMSGNSIRAVKLCAKVEIDGMAFNFLAASKFDLSTLEQMLSRSSSVALKNQMSVVKDFDIMNEERGVLAWILYVENRLSEADGTSISEKIKEAYIRTSNLYDSSEESFMWISEIVASELSVSEETDKLFPNSGTAIYTAVTVNGEQVLQLITKEILEEVLGSFTTERQETLSIIEETQDEHSLSYDSLFYFYMKEKVRFTNHANLINDLKAKWQGILGTDPSKIEVVIQRQEETFLADGTLVIKVLYSVEEDDKFLDVRLRGNIDSSEIVQIFDSISDTYTVIPEDLMNTVRKAELCLFMFEQYVDVNSTETKNELSNIVKKAMSTALGESESNIELTIYADIRSIFDREYVTTTGYAVYFDTIVSGERTTICPSFNENFTAEINANLQASVEITTTMGTKARAHVVEKDEFYELTDCHPIRLSSPITRKDKVLLENALETAWKLHRSLDASVEVRVEITFQTDFVLMKSGQIAGELIWEACMMVYEDNIEIDAEIYDGLQVSDLQSVFQTLIDGGSVKFTDVPLDIDLEQDGMLEYTDGFRVFLETPVMENQFSDFATAIEDVWANEMTDYANIKITVGRQTRATFEGRILTEMVYFVEDTDSQKYILPRTINVDAMMQLMIAINNKIDSLTITGNLGQKYVTVNVTMSETYRLELGALVCSDGYVPMHLEDDFLTGVQGGFDNHDPDSGVMLSFGARQETFVDGVLGTCSSFFLSVDDIQVTGTMLEVPPTPTLKSNIQATIDVIDVVESTEIYYFRDGHTLGFQSPVRSSVIDTLKNNLKTVYSSKLTGVVDIYIPQVSSQFYVAKKPLDQWEEYSTLMYFVTENGEVIDSFSVEKLAQGDIDTVLDIDIPDSTTGGKYKDEYVEVLLSLPGTYRQDAELHQFALSDMIPESSMTQMTDIFKEVFKGLSDTMNVTIEAVLQVPSLTETQQAVKVLCLITTPVGVVVRPADVDPSIANDFFAAFQGQINATTSLKSTKDKIVTAIDTTKTKVVRKTLAFTCPMEVLVSYTDRQDVYEGALMDAFKAQFQEYASMDLVFSPLLDDVVVNFLGVTTFTIRYSVHIAGTIISPLIMGQVNESRYKDELTDISITGMSGVNYGDVVKGPVPIAGAPYYSLEDLAPIPLEDFVERKLLTDLNTALTTSIQSMSQFDEVKTNCTEFKVEVIYQEQTFNDSGVGVRISLAVLCNGELLINAMLPNIDLDVIANEVSNVESIKETVKVVVTGEAEGSVSELWTQRLFLQKPDSPLTKDDVDILISAVEEAYTGIGLTNSKVRVAGGLYESISKSSKINQGVDFFIMIDGKVVWQPVNAANVANALQGEMTSAGEAFLVISDSQQNEEQRLASSFKLLFTEKLKRQDVTDIGDKFALAWDNFFKDRIGIDLGAGDLTAEVLAVIDRYDINGTRIFEYVYQLNSKKAGRRDSRIEGVITRSIAKSALDQLPIAGLGGKTYGDALFWAANETRQVRKLCDLTVNNFVSMNIAAEFNTFMKTEFETLFSAWQDVAIQLYGTPTFVWRKRRMLTRLYYEITTGGERRECLYKKDEVDSFKDQIRDKIGNDIKDNHHRSVMVSKAESDKLAAETGLFKLILNKATDSENTEKVIEAIKKAWDNKYPDDAPHEVTSELQFPSVDEDGNLAWNQVCSVKRNDGQELDAEVEIPPSETDIENELTNEGLGDFIYRKNEDNLRELTDSYDLTFKEELNEDQLRRVEEYYKAAYEKKFGGTVTINVRKQTEATSGNDLFHRTLIFITKDSGEAVNAQTEAGITPEDFNAEVSDSDKETMDAMPSDRTDDMQLLIQGDPLCFSESASALDFQLFKDSFLPVFQALYEGESLDVEVPFIDTMVDLSGEFHDALYVYLILDGIIMWPQTTTFPTISDLQATLTSWNSLAFGVPYELCATRQTLRPFRLSRMIPMTCVLMDADRPSLQVALRNHYADNILNVGRSTITVELLGQPDYIGMNREFLTSQHYFVYSDDVLERGTILPKLNTVTINTILTSIEKSLLAGNMNYGSCAQTEEEKNETEPSISTKPLLQLGVDKKPGEDEDSLRDIADALTDAMEKAQGDDGAKNVTVKVLGVECMIGDDGAEAWMLYILILVNGMPTNANDVKHPLLPDIQREFNARSVQTVNGENFEIVNHENYVLCKDAFCISSNTEVSKADEENVAAAFKAAYLQEHPNLNADDVEVTFQKNQLLIETDGDFLWSQCFSVRVNDEEKSSRSEPPLSNDSVKDEMDKVPKTGGDDDDTYGDDLTDDSDPDAQPYPFHLCVDTDKPVGVSGRSVVAQILADLFTTVNTGIIGVWTGESRTEDNVQMGVDCSVRFRSCYLMSVNSTPVDIRLFKFPEVNVLEAQLTDLVVFSPFNNQEGSRSSSQNKAFIARKPDPTEAQEMRVKDCIKQVLRAIDGEIRNGTIEVCDRERYISEKGETLLAYPYTITGSDGEDISQSLPTKEMEDCLNGSPESKSEDDDDNEFLDYNKLFKFDLSKKACVGDFSEMEKRVKEVWCAKRFNAMGKCDQAVFDIIAQEDGFNAVRLGDLGYRVIYTVELDGTFLDAEFETEVPTAEEIFANLDFPRCNSSENYDNTTFPDKPENLTLKEDLCSFVVKQGVAVNIYLEVQRIIQEIYQADSSLGTVTVKAYTSVPVILDDIVRAFTFYYEAFGTVDGIAGTRLRCDVDLNAIKDEMSKKDTPGGENYDVISPSPRDVKEEANACQLHLNRTIVEADYAATTIELVKAWKNVFNLDAEITLTVQPEMVSRDGQDILYRLYYFVTIGGILLDARVDPCLLLDDYTKALENVEVSTSSDDENYGSFVHKENDTDDLIEYDWGFVVHVKDEVSRDHFSDFKEKLEEWWRTKSTYAGKQIEVNLAIQEEILDGDKTILYELRYFVLEGEDKTPLNSAMVQSPTLQDLLDLLQIQGPRGLYQLDDDVRQPVRLMRHAMFLHLDSDGIHNDYFDQFEAALRTVWRRINSDLQIDVVIQDEYIYKGRFTTALVYFGLQDDIVVNPMIISQPSINSIRAEVSSFKNQFEEDWILLQRSDEFYRYRFAFGINVSRPVLHNDINTLESQLKSTWESELGIEITVRVVLQERTISKTRGSGWLVIYFLFDKDGEIIHSPVVGTLSNDDLMVILDFLVDGSTTDKYKDFLLTIDVDTYIMERLLHFIVFDSMVTEQQYNSVGEVFKEVLLSQDVRDVTPDPMTTVTFISSTGEEVFALFFAIFDQNNKLVFRSQIRPLPVQEIDVILSRQPITTVKERSLVVINTLVVDVYRKADLFGINLMTRPGLADYMLLQKAFIDAFNATYSVDSNVVMESNLITTQRYVAAHKSSIYRMLFYALRDGSKLSAEIMGNLVRAGVETAFSAVTGYGQTETYGAMLANETVDISTYFIGEQLGGIVAMELVSRPDLDAVTTVVEGFVQAMNAETTTATVTFIMEEEVIFKDRNGLLRSYWQLQFAIMKDNVLIDYRSVPDMDIDGIANGLIAAGPDGSGTIGVNIRLATDVSIMQVMSIDLAVTVYFRATLQTGDHVQVLNRALAIYNDQLEGVFEKSTLTFIRVEEFFSESAVDDSYLVSGIRFFIMSENSRLQYQILPADVLRIALNLLQVREFQLDTTLISMEDMFVPTSWAFKVYMQRKIKLRDTANFGTKFISLLQTQAFANLFSGQISGILALQNEGFNVNARGERVIVVQFPVKAGLEFLNCRFETRTCAFPAADIETELMNLRINDGTNEVTYYSSTVYKGDTENIVLKPNLCVAIFNTKIAPESYEKIEAVILEVFNELDRNTYVDQTATIVGQEPVIFKNRVIAVAVYYRSTAINRAVSCRNYEEAFANRLKERTYVSRPQGGFYTSVDYKSQADVVELVKSFGFYLNERIKLDDTADIETKLVAEWSTQFIGESAVIKVGSQQQMIHLREAGSGAFKKTVFAVHCVVTVNGHVRDAEILDVFPMDSALQTALDVDIIGAVPTQTYFDISFQRSRASELEEYEKAFLITINNDIGETLLGSISSNLKSTWESVNEFVGVSLTIQTAFVDEMIDDEGRTMFQLGYFITKTATSDVLDARVEPVLSLQALQSVVAVDGPLGRYMIPDIIDYPLRRWEDAVVLLMDNRLYKSDETNMLSSVGAAWQAVNANSSVLFAKLEPYLQAQERRYGFVYFVAFDGVVVSSKVLTLIGRSDVLAQINFKDPTGNDYLITIDTTNAFRERHFYGALLSVPMKYDDIPTFLTNVQGAWETQLGGNSPGMEQGIEIEYVSGDNPGVSIYGVLYLVLTDPNDPTSIVKPDITAPPAYTTVIDFTGQTTGVVYESDSLVSRSSATNLKYFDDFFYIVTTTQVARSSFQDFKSPIKAAWSVQSQEFALVNIDVMLSEPYLTENKEIIWFLFYSVDVNGIPYLPSDYTGPSYGNQVSEITVNDPFQAPYELYEIEPNFKIWRLNTGFDINFGGVIKTVDEAVLSSSIGEQWTDAQNPAEVITIQKTYVVENIGMSLELEGASIFQLKYFAANSMKIIDARFETQVAVDLSSVRVSDELENYQDILFTGDVSTLVEYRHLFCVALVNPVNSGDKTALEEKIGTAWSSSKPEYSGMMVNLRLQELYFDVATGTFYTSLMYDATLSGRRISPEDLPELEFNRLMSIETLMDALGEPYRLARLSCRDLKRYAISQGALLDRYVPLVDVEKVRGAIEETFIEMNEPTMPSYSGVNVQFGIQEWFVKDAQRVVRFGVFSRIGRRQLDGRRERPLNAVLLGTKINAAAPSVEINPISSSTTLSSQSLSSNNLRLALFLFVDGMVASSDVGSFQVRLKIAWQTKNPTYDIEVVLNEEYVGIDGKFVSGLAYFVKQGNTILDPRTILHPSQETYDQSVVVTNSIKNGIYKLYTQNAYRYAELYQIDLIGEVLDENDILTILMPYYENLDNVDVAQLTYVKTERIFGKLGTILSRLLYRLSFDGKDLFPEFVEGLPALQIRDAIMQGGLTDMVFSGDSKDLIRQEHTFSVMIRGRSDKSLKDRVEEQLRTSSIWNMDGVTIVGAVFHTTTSTEEYLTEFRYTVQNGNTMMSVANTIEPSSTTLFNTLSTTLNVNTFSLASLRIHRMTVYGMVMQPSYGSVTNALRSAWLTIQGVSSAEIKIRNTEIMAATKTWESVTIIEYTVNVNGGDGGTLSPTSAVLTNVLNATGHSFCDCINSARAIRSIQLKMERSAVDNSLTAIADRISTAYSQVNTGILDSENIENLAKVNAIRGENSFYKTNTDEPVTMVDLLVYIKDNPSQVFYNIPTDDDINTALLPEFPVCIGDCQVIQCSSIRVSCVVETKEEKVPNIVSAYLAANGGLSSDDIEVQVTSISGSSPETVLDFCVTPMDGVSPSDIVVPNDEQFANNLNCEIIPVSSGGEGGGTPDYIIIIMVVAVVIAVILLLLALMKVCYRHRKKREEAAIASRAVPNDYSDPEYAGHAKYGSSLYSYDKYGPSSAYGNSENIYDKVK